MFVTSYSLILKHAFKQPLTSNRQLCPGSILLSREESVGILHDFPFETQRLFVLWHVVYQLDERPIVVRTVVDVSGHTDVQTAQETEQLDLYVVLVVQIIHQADRFLLQTKRLG